ncbi:MAG: hypothetical protein FWF79_05730 [Defluviitaleaceae bacterium]|nr:hypothetical protein [Defluviitaleaceae bacterium]
MTWVNFLKQNKFLIIFIALAAVMAVTIIVVAVLRNGDEYELFAEAGETLEETQPAPVEVYISEPEEEHIIENDENDDDEPEEDTRPNRPLRTYFPSIHDDDFAEAMPLFDRLMCPFTFFAYSVGASAETLAAYGIPADGKVTTAAHWELRRSEIRDLMMYYYYGYKWPTTYENVTVNTTARPDGTGTESGSEINITINDTRLDGSPTTATGDIAFGTWLPSFEQLEANGFWCTQTNTGTGGPLVIANFHFFTEPQIEAFLERGIGLTLVFGSPGWSESRDGIYFDLFPFDRYVTQYNTGTLMASAWHFSRIIDVFYLRREWGVNPNAIAVLGNSFAGKRALFAGIMDDRVALVIPHESGGDGGVAPFRHSHSGRIHFYNADGVNRVHSRHETTRTGNSGRGASGAVASFFRRAGYYEESIYLLPFDMHLAIALAAPTAANPQRAFLSLETDNFGTWTGWGPARTANAAAAEVFHFLGSDNIAFRMRNSSHALTDSDYPVIWAILDYLFGKPVHDTTTGFRGNRNENQVYVEDLWNVALPGVFNSIGELSRTPIEIYSAWMPWSRPEVFTLWTENQIVTAGLPATITAHTDASHAELILWTHGDGNVLRNAANPPRILGTWLAEVIDGIATFELSGEEVQVGRFQLLTRDYGGARYGERSVFFQAIDVHTALRHGTTRDNVGGGNDSTMIGFTSRINPETLRTYIRGADGNESGINAAHFQSGGNWIMPYGVRFNAIPGEGDERAFIMRGLQFEAMPGFTFELSMQENLHTAGQPAAIWQASPEVQFIGAYPHWRPGGAGAGPTAEPLSPVQLRGTSFDIGFTVGWVANAEAGEEVDSLTISFDAPVNPRDFGIGFNFSDFSLSWNDENTSLQIALSTIPEEEIIMYIFRARAEDANQHNDVINTPLRYSFMP